MGNYNGFADEIIKAEIKEHYPHDRLVHFNDSDSELEKVKYSELHLYRGNGLPIGSAYENGELVYYLRPYEHTMIHGLSGSGKTTVFYENFFLCLAGFPDDRKSSMIYIDYKHDVLRKHRQYLADHGYTVLTLDLLDPMYSNTWNPLENKVRAYISAIQGKDEKALIDVDQFIQGLGNCICPTPPDVRDPMWSQGGRGYICSLIYTLFDLAAAGFICPEDVTFENIQGLHKFIRAFWMKKRANLGNSVLTLSDIANLKPFALLGETFTKSDYVSAFMTVLGCGSITGSSYFATIEPALSIFCDQSILRVTRSSASRESIDFEKMLEKPTFICISPSGTPGSNMLISMFFDRLFDFVRAKTAHKPLERSLHVLLDEVCNMGCIDNLCTYISTTRSMRAYFHLGVQSDSMLAARYGEFNSINLRNNLTEMFFGSQEKSTLNRFVSQGGETTTVDLNCRLGICDHIMFKTHNVVTTSDLSIMPLGTFFVRQGRHMLLKSSMIPSFAVKEFQNLEVAQEDQDEIITISKKLDFSRLEDNQKGKKTDEQETVFIQALWECIKSGKVSISFIQRKLSISYNHAGKAIEWMEECGYITAFPKRKVMISQDEFIEKFGNPNKETDSEEDERQRYIEERRRALMERLLRMNDDDDKEDDENNDDEADDDFDDTVDEGEETNDLRSVLMKSIEIGLQEISEQNKFILGLNGGSQFELKYVQEGDALRISDGGNTLLQVNQSKQRVKSLLKDFAPVALNGNEVFIEIENPLGTLMALLTLYSAIDAIKKLK